MIQDKEELLVFELPGDKMVKLMFRSSTEPLDVDDLTKIHYHNLFGDILTVPVLLNRIGNLVAEAEEMVKSAEFDLEIHYNQLQEEKRKSLTIKCEPDKKGNVKFDRPTAPEVLAAIISDSTYKTKKYNLFKIEKNHKHLNSLYWAIQSKSKLLEKLSDKLRPDELEKDLVEETINGIQIKLLKKSIQ